MNLTIKTLPSVAGVVASAIMLSGVAAAGTPVNGYCQSSAPTGYSVVRCPLYTVPAGKRLIVESVSWRLIQSFNNTWSDLIFGLDTAEGTPTVNFLPSARTVFIQHLQTSTDGTTVSMSEGTQSVKLVYEAGEVFSSQYTYGGSGPDYYQITSFQGHLENQ